MASKKPVSVEDYFSALQHPHKAGVEMLRSAILGIDSRIKEEVKWNAPSFYIEEHFATFRLHPGNIFQLILHAGAKPKDSPKQFHLDDPQGLLKWVAKDRCIISFESDGDVKAKLDEVVRMVTEWVAQL